MDQTIGILTQDLISAKSKQVGIDWDRGTDISLLQTLFNAKHIADEVKIFKSSSERGYHFILLFKDELSTKARLDIRYFLGDCSGRLYFSEKRGGDDVLFDIKTQGNNWKNRREIPIETLLNLNGGRTLQWKRQSMKRRLRNGV